MYADDSIICVAANTEKKVKCISKFWVTIGVKNKTLISYVSLTNSMTFGSNHAIRKNRICKVSINVPVAQVHETKLPGVILDLDRTY